MHEESRGSNGKEFGPSIILAIWFFAGRLLVRGVFQQNYIVTIEYWCHRSFIAATECLLGGEG